MTTCQNRDKPLLALSNPILIIAFLLTACGLHENPRRGSIIDTWQNSSDSVEVRITVYREVGTYLNGAYYVFESAPVESEHWEEFMEFRHDDDVPIPKNQVRFVDSRTAYVFIGWMYAITTNGGEDWSVWDAKINLPDWQCCNYSLIRDVELSSSGTGTMILNPIPYRRGEVAKLRTTDYGFTWIVTE